MSAAINPNLAFLRPSHKLQKRFNILQGGTRSGKTYAALQYLLFLASQYELKILITRDYYTVLRDTVLADFFEVAEAMGYSRKLFHWSSKTFKIGSSVFKFLGADDPDKVKGFKADIVYINEATSYPFLVFQQLDFRLRGFFVIDYNPSEPEGWYYDLLDDPRSRHIITSYLDNPFLTIAQKESIEKLKATDPDAWAVFGEGKRGQGRQGQIITHATPIEKMPEGVYKYGLDFGKTNDPTVLLRVLETDDSVYVQELCYRSGLTVPEIEDVFKAHKVRPGDYIYADSAESLIIQELQGKGWNIYGAAKGPGSIQFGIEKIKAKKLFYTIDSLNFKKESEWYRWKIDKATGKPTNEPIGSFNHAWDALRYSLITDKVQQAGETVAHRIPHVRGAKRIGH